MNKAQALGYDLGDNEQEQSLTGKYQQIDQEKYHLAYNVIGPIIENCIRANKGEDGLILVDYAELRDALAEALVGRKKMGDIEARIDELVNTYNNNFIHWGDDLEKAKVDVQRRLTELWSLQKKGKM